MATYVDREQMAHRRAIQRRYDEDQRRLAGAIALILLLYARPDATGKRTLPTSQQMRGFIKMAIWAQVLKPYYIGQGQEAFSSDRPQSPYAQLLRDGVEGAIRIQVRRQEGLLRRYIKDTTVLAWLLMAGQPIELPPVKQANYQQPFWAWVDPNGYKLNDRITRNAIDARAKLDRMLDYHISQGTDADSLAAKVRNFMTISGRSTGKEYGDYGSYAPWKLLRSEMLVGFARATVIASMLNPVVDAVQWRLSPTHRDLDECDFNATGGRNGDGVYPVNQAPAYPNHPNERCTLVPVASAPENIVTAGLRGVLNVASLTAALLTQPAAERERA